MHIRYDNLKPAVKQVLLGRSRVESSRWASFKSWYQFSAFYCAPGEDGAHEKGGVEHEGGRFRRKHLVPPPAVESLAELNERLAAIDVAEDARHIHGRPTSIGFDFEAERGLLRPLPADDFDCGIDLMPTVARNSRVTVRQGYYSVPPQRLPQAVETGQFSPCNPARKPHPPHSTARWPHQRVPASSLTEPRQTTWSPAEPGFSRETGPPDLGLPAAAVLPLQPIPVANGTNCSLSR
jgi:hypothetical protein